MKIAPVGWARRPMHVSSAQSPDIDDNVMLSLNNVYMHIKFNKDRETIYKCVVIKLLKMCSCSTFDLLLKFATDKQWHLHWIWFAYDVCN